MKTNEQHIVAGQEVLVRVEGVSKKFAKGLKKSLLYGVYDVWRGILRKPKGNSLRPDEFWAVKEVSFELRRGECLGLIGHNGAGKSTLLKILNGLINPDEGVVTIKGRVGALIELGAGFNPILTGRENIYNNGAILGFSKQEIDAKLDTIIDFAELREFIDMPVQNYSSGMKVRLGFAVAAQMEPDVLIIDEVLAVGDLGFVLKCFKTIDAILPKTAVVFVSHSMPMVSRICNHIILMNYGKVKYQGLDVSKGISLYYDKFITNGRQIIFDTGEVQLLSSLIKVKAENLDEAILNWCDDLILEVVLDISKLTFIPYVSMNIYDKEKRGVAVLGEYYPQITTKNKDVIKLIFKHKELQLSKGKYFLDLIVMEKEGLGPLLRINEINTITIENSKETWPPFLLKTSIEAIV